jgi:predicted acetyltransferase
MRPAPRAIRGSEPLGDGLVLRSLKTAADANRYATLNENVVGEGAIARRLIERHPAMAPRHFIFVEDKVQGDVVSTSCLIPWRWRLDGLELRVAMLEMVATDPRYRRRGLVRAQVERFHALAEAEGFDLTVIQGIPYYYRQFGYTYALDHYPCDRLASHQIPRQDEDGAHPIRFRQAVPDDAARLTELYRAAMEPIQMVVERDEAYWRYLIQRSQVPIYVWAETAGSCPLDGYLMAQIADDGRRAIVAESHVRHADDALSALQTLAAGDDGTPRDEVSIGGHDGSLLLRVARALGSHPRPRYQWLIRVPDIAAFLTCLRPVLTRRLAAGGYATRSGTLRLNLYREAFDLQIHDGRLVDVARLGFVDYSLTADGGDLCIPRDAFVRLALGYRDLDQLRDAWPDIRIRHGRRYLFDALFPPISALLNMPY